MSARVTVQRFRSGDELATVAAELLLESALESVTARGRWLMALAGGSTPGATYSLLASPRYARGVPWHRTHLFLGDERWLPITDADSNAGMIRSRLTDPLLAQGIEIGGTHLPVSADTVIGDEPELGACVRSYRQELATVAGVSLEGPPPELDMVMLGMGADGHVASVFPASPRCGPGWVVPVAAAEVGENLPAVARISFGLDLICRARKVLLLATGAQKVAIIDGALSPSSRSVPGENESEAEEPRLPVEYVLAKARSVVALLAG